MLLTLIALELLERDIVLDDRENQRQITRSSAVTFAAKSSVRIESDTVQVDPQLLFQRLIVACNRSDNLQGLFRYELCSYPVALFDSSLTLRQPQKPILVDAIWTKLSSNATLGPEGGQHLFPEREKCRELGLEKDWH